MSVKRTDVIVGSHIRVTGNSKTLEVMSIQEIKGKPTRYKSHPINQAKYEMLYPTLNQITEVL